MTSNGRAIRNHSGTSCRQKPSEARAPQRNLGGLYHINHVRERACDGRAPILVEYHPTDR